MSSCQAVRVLKHSQGQKSFIPKICVPSFKSLQIRGTQQMFVEPRRTECIICYKHIVYQTAIFSYLCACAQESSVAGRAQEISAGALRTCRSLATVEALCTGQHVPLSSPHLCGRDSCSVKPAHKEAGRLHKPVREKGPEL